MAPTTAAPRKIPATVLVAGAIMAALLIAFAVYLSLPAHKTAPPGPTPEAKAYLDHLALSDVNMKAAENFMQQQVVEIQGKISNNGPRPIRRLVVLCVFNDVSGHAIYQERVPVVQGGN